MGTPVYSARVRPFALPERLDDLAGPKPAGVVRLPAHLSWSQDRSFDLTRRPDRRRLYEQVLREGTLDDLRRYIDVDQLVGLWDELFLPAPVRRAWARLLNEQRGLNLEC